MTDCTYIATLANLQKEVKELKDQVLRSYAEEENVRRIARRDVDNAKSYANTSFAKAMLDVADDLERALAIVPAEKRVAASGSAEILSPLLQHNLSV
jgi:molecular chaperone GrpE